MAKRLPWGKFQWEAWETDPALSLCSMAAQGFWMRLLCICAKSEGQLLIGGKKPSNDVLAHITRQSIPDVEIWLAELHGNGVFSRTRGGVIFSRRMVGELEASAQARKNGKLGGNPALVGGRDAPEGDDQKERSREFDERSGSVRESSDEVAREIETQDADLMEKSGGWVNPRLKLEEEEEEDKEPPTPKTGDEVREAFDLWNETAAACGLPMALDLTPSRRRAIGKRLKEHGGQGWGRALLAVSSSKFCRGLAAGRDGARPFRADIDFVAQARSFQRLLEGYYGADAEPPRQAAPAVEISPEDRWRAAIRRFQQNLHWPDELGPRPGRHGCAAPMDIQAEFGFADDVHDLIATAQGAAA